MANVVRSHGGDCSGDPPRPPHRRLPRSCQSAPPSKRRGISRNLNLEKQWLNGGKKPLPIEFDSKFETLQPIGNSAGMFTRLVGNTVRLHCLPCYSSWADVPEELRARVLTAVETYFDLRGGRSAKEYEDALGGLDRLAADRYRAYKNKANEHFRENGPSRPYGEISVEDWQRCLDLFTSPNFLARSEKNKVNREKARYISRQGSRSLSATRYKERNPETGEWLGIVDAFERLHKREDGEWVNENAAGDYDLLVMTRETQQTQAASIGTQADERAIVKEALGERRGFLRGVGRIPKGKSPSIKSSAASLHAPARNTQSLEVPHSEDRLELYKTEMQTQMETMMRVIRRLAANQGFHFYRSCSWSWTSQFCDHAVSCYKEHVLFSPMDFTILYPDISYWKEHVRCIQQEKWF